MTLLILPLMESVEADDPLQKVLYIGTLIVTSGMLLVTRVHLARHPGCQTASRSDLRRGMSIDLSMMVLFAVALAIALVLPGIGYLGLFVMFFTGPVQSVVARMLRVRPH